jgi:hypothetical protein
VPPALLCATRAASVAMPAHSRARLRALLEDHLRVGRRLERHHLVAGGLERDRLAAAPARILPERNDKGTLGVSKQSRPPQQQGKQGTCCEWMPKRMPCNTAAGADIVLEAIRSSRFQASPEMEDPRWWANKNCKSTLQLRCTVCTFCPDHATVDKFMRRRSAACWCNNQAKWSTDQGVERLKQLIADSRFELRPLVEWNTLQLKLCSETKLPLVCAICKYEPPECLLRHFKETHTAACWCNGQALYASAEGHTRVLSVVAAAGLQPSEDLCRLEWYLANVHGEHDTVPVICPDCNSVVTSTSISNLTQRQSAGCDCRWKTQRMIRDWVAEHISRLYPEIDVVFELKAAERIQSKGAGGRMAYDVALQEGPTTILILEIDGRQHFDPMSEWEATQVNDVSKEIAAVEDGTPMLRLSQVDVWRKKFEWQAWLEKMIRLAVSKQLAATVHRQPGCVSYTSGQYVARRRGSVVDVV